MNLTQYTSNQLAYSRNVTSPALPFPPGVNPPSNDSFMYELGRKSVLEVFVNATFFERLKFLFKL